MTRRLHLSNDLTLPLDAATESFAILGRRGSGKTHTAVVMAEELLTAGVQVVVIDPLDVWWGLRVSKDGKEAGFPIYVAGGSHKDIPLSADAGKVLADAVVDQGLSIVLSTRHLSKADQRRFVGDFCERLYDRKADPQHRTALHVDIDEADAFVPQRLMPGAERCFGAVDTLVRRGRSSGLAVTLISQRPQVINKDVLSQTEVLVSHQLTGPQDRKALQAWIEANDDENRSAEFMGALASLPKGRAWFWSPGLLKVFKPVNVRDRTTFDSSATPKPGVIGLKPKAFAAVDLDKLTAEIAATIERAKADDPRELRRQIAELKKQASSTPVSLPPERKAVSTLTDADRALLIKFTAQLHLIETEISGAQVELLGEHLKVAEESLRRVWGQFEGIHQTERVRFAKLLESKGFQKILDKLSALSPQPSAQDSRRPAGPRAVLPTGRSSAATRPTEARAPRGADRSGPAGVVTGKALEILNALAELEALGAREPERVLVALLSGYTNLTSKGFVNALSALSSAGHVHYPRGGAVALTDSGRAIATPPIQPRTSAEIQQRVLQLLGGKTGEILKPIIAAYPDAVPREDVAAAAGYTNLTSKGFVNALSRLSSLGFVKYPSPRMVAAAPVLFLEN